MPVIHISDLQPGGLHGDALADYRGLYGRNGLGLAAELHDVLCRRALGALDDIELNAFAF